MCKVLPVSGAQPMSVCLLPRFLVSSVLVFLLRGWECLYSFSIVYTCCELLSMFFKHSLSMLTLLMHPLLTLLVFSTLHYPTPLIPGQVIPIPCHPSINTFFLYPPGTRE
ncbi:hypothetical protein F5Y07DRAFT_369098 [Xylaria sp. FL0933]|nr:hypothetical protein F5Y07DRAFT_369098 [Xylaria sp. FL0933]